MRAATLRRKWRYWTSRWPVADALHRTLGDRVCWPDLVMWALASRGQPCPPRLFGDDGALTNGSAPRCRAEVARGDVGVCYCGKFQSPEVASSGYFNPGVVVESETAS